MALLINEKEDITEGNYYEGNTENEKRRERREGEMYEEKAQRIKSDGRRE